MTYMGFKIVECFNPHRWVAFGAKYEDQYSVTGFRWARQRRELFTTNPNLITLIQKEQPKAEEILFDIDK